MKFKLAMSHNNTKLKRNMINFALKRTLKMQLKQVFPILNRKIGFRFINIVIKNHYTITIYKPEQIVKAYFLLQNVF